MIMKTTSELPPDLWWRDWEFLYRAADLLWAKLGDHRIVFGGRLEYFCRLGCEPTPCSDLEAQRYRPDFKTVCDWMAHRWRLLFDAWAQNPLGFVFDDAFSALFLLRLLWANDVLILRGHYDARWKPTTSLSRAQQRGPRFITAAVERSQQFLEQLQQLPLVQREYPSGIPELHAAAILQHYGFPTDLLDCTYSWDIALYFAEGGKDDLPLSTSVAEMGAIYAFPTRALPRSAILTTLPPAIMRPSLQRGVFLGNLTSRDQAELEQYKLTFRHQFLPLWNGLGGIDFGSPMGLGRYLFPMSDPIEAVARPLRETLVDIA